MSTIVKGTDQSDLLIATEAAEVFNASQGSDYIRGFDVSQDVVDITPWIPDGVSQDQLGDYVKLVFWGGHTVLVFDPVGYGDSEQAQLLTLLDVDLSQYSSIDQLLDAGLVNWNGTDIGGGDDNVLTGTDGNDTYTATSAADTIEVSGGMDFVIGFDASRDVIDVSPWLPKGVTLDNAYEYIKLGAWNGNTVLAIDPDGSGGQNITHILTLENADLKNNGDIYALIDQGILTGIPGSGGVEPPPETDRNIITGTNGNDTYTATDAADTIEVSGGMDFVIGFDASRDIIDVSPWLPEGVTLDNAYEYIKLGAWNGNTVLAIDPDGSGGQNITHILTLENADLKNNGDIYALIDQGILTGIGDGGTPVDPEPSPSTILSGTSNSEVYTGTDDANIFVASQGYDTYQNFDPAQDSINLAPWLPSGVNADNINDYVIVGQWNGNAIIAIDPDGIGNGNGATHAITVEGVDLSGYGGASALLQAGLLTGVPQPSEGLSSRIDLQVIANGDGREGFVIHGTEIGESVSNAGDVNDDGIDDFLVASPISNVPEEGGEVYLIYGREDGYPADIDRDDIVSSQGELGTIFRNADAVQALGTNVSSAGDMNGDGIDDIVFSTPLSPRIGMSGLTHVVYGRTGGLGAEVDVDSFAAGDGSVGTTIVGPEFNDFAGVDVEGIGDVNADGFDDILINSMADRSTPDQGLVEQFIVYGSEGGLGSQIRLADIESGDSDQGVALSNDGLLKPVDRDIDGAGDFNGDGIDDVIVREGYFGPAVLYGSQQSPDALFNLTSLSNGDGELGVVLDLTSLTVDLPIGDRSLSDVSVSKAGDVNDDGIDDVLLGLPLFDRAYVVYGQQGNRGARVSLDEIEKGDLSQGFAIRGLGLEMPIGQTVSEAGDVNGDGIDDIIIGGTLTETGADLLISNNAQSYVIYGQSDDFDQSIDLADLQAGISAKGLVIDGSTAGGGAGSIVSTAGDINNDGIDDLIIGAPGENSGNGSSYILFGQGTNNNIIGTDNADVLDGTSGDDNLTGLAGADQFIASLGNDTVTDFLFTEGDTLDFSALLPSDANIDDHVSVEQYDSYASVTAMSDSGLSVTRLEGVDLGDLDSASALVDAGYFVY